MEIPTPEERLTLLELQVQQLHELADAHELVLTWLLDQAPKDAALRFLCGQANELEGEQRCLEDVALLDHLRELLLRWRERSAGGRSRRD